MHFQLETIAIVHSCYKQKFATPRQPGLVQEAKAIIELVPPYNNPDSVRGLQGFSHIWLHFIFHQCIRAKWSALVRPPRLGGKEKIGVFATRSNFRPNPIGLSLVRLEQVEIQDNQVLLHVSGIDLIEGTPVIDIKPYLPYADNAQQAKTAYVDGAPEMLLAVYFSEQAEQQLQQLVVENGTEFKQLICKILSMDPRPEHYKDFPSKEEYGFCINDVEVKFYYNGDGIVVDKILDNK